MIDLEAMQVGDVLPLTTGKRWEPEQRAEYQRAQEYSRSSGRRFEVDTIYKDLPGGRTPAGFTIKRTK